MPRRTWALCALVLLAGCATSEPAARPQAKHAAAPANDSEEESPLPVLAPRHATPPPPEEARPERTPTADAAAAPQARTAADPFGDVGFHEVNEKDWLASIKEKIAKQEKVEPTDLRLSPGLLRAAYRRSPPVTPPKPGRKPAPRRHEIVVVDNQGRRVASFRPVTAPKSDEPPKDLRFLGEERLVYEVVAPPPPPAPPAAKAAPAAKTKARPAARPNAKKKAPPAPVRAAAPTPPPGPPPRTFVIQPIAPRARPIKCVGLHHTFTKERDHLAFVAGQPEASFVAVDGAQIYPRRGRTIVASAPSWSKDGHSLAFLESLAERPTRLVLVAEIDNATGDTTWDLPPTANTDGALVHWAGTGKLVVGRTQMRPIFSASFTKELPGR